MQLHEKNNPGCQYNLKKKKKSRSQPLTKILIDSRFGLLVQLTDSLSSENILKKLIEFCTEVRPFTFCTSLRPSPFNQHHRETFLQNSN